jgi:hypothetical protein
MDAGARMTEHPILFKGHLVREILAGRKTVTRRIVRIGDHARAQFGSLRNGVASFHDSIPDDPCPIEVKCPYGVAGDKLWVREMWRTIGEVPTSECSGPRDILFAASASETQLAIHKWRPSIHLPRWASRIDLQVRSVRVERLRDITEKEAKSEGVAPWKEKTYPVFAADNTPAADSPYRAGFAWSWDEINHDRMCWRVNPWVFVVQFSLLEVRR